MQTNHRQIASAQMDGGEPAAELIARYLAGPALLEEAMREIDDEQLRARPVPGKWSSLEVLAHVADCEQFYADRMKRTIAMERPLLLGADGWLYPEALHYHLRDARLDLELVRATRAQMARDLESLTPEAWERTAVHSETGLVSLRQLLLHAIRHLDWHVETIREKRGAMGLDA
jgi:uncharacterized damage-inducible protein DinB